MRQDNQKKFLAAYDQYADAIYRHCFFRVYSKARAQELMQETFMKAWQYERAGQTIENLRAFLYQIATNLIIDESRKKKEESLEMLLQNAPGAEPATDSRPNIEHDILIKDIKVQMERLPEEARDILTLRFIDDLEPKEIALILKISANHASVKINRALQLLRDQIEKTNQL